MPIRQHGRQSAQPAEPGKTAGRWLLVAVALGGLVVSTCADRAASAQQGRVKAVRRAAAPAGRWDPVTRGTFAADAFTLLEGPRPDDGLAVQRPADATDPDADGGATWSALVSADTLVDEVKDLKDMLAGACRTASDFKGGGFEEARCGFSSLAVVFGVIAAYDQPDVRWRKDAATARDRFARAGFACRAGTDQSFAEAQARLEDLAGLLEGSPPGPGPGPRAVASWSGASDRPPLMTRLEMAQDALRRAAASPQEFARRADELLHAVEVIAMIGEVIQQPDFEHHDDDGYRGHAAAMRDAALKVRDACRDGDYEAARAAAGGLEQSCDACHGDYRG